MRHSIAILAVSLAVLPLGACASDTYGHMGYGYGYGYGAYPYNGWYDGYYGPIYDGYWGNDGYFYYRSNRHERAYRRGDRDHFRRDGAGHGPRYHEMRGRLHYQHGATMPSFPRGDRRGGHRGRHRGD